MAKVYLTEFKSVGWGGLGTIQVVDVTGAVENASSPLTTSGSSGPFAALQASTRAIRVHTDGIISLSIGSAATTSKMRLAANQTEYFAVRGGEVVEAITNT